MKGFNFREFLKEEKNYYLFYILFLLSYVAYYLVQWPIFAGDTDLWYHLNGGRYIVEHGTIPKDSSFFSFIEPPREWINYYWLFQVLVYKIHSFSGYYGLVFLRAIVFAATVLFVYLVLNKAFKNKPDLYTTIIFSLCVLFLLPRFHLVRPHIFTYFFIALSVYLLDFKRKYIFFLPIIGIFWVNFHGVAYPILLLLVLACLSELFFKHVFNKQHLQKDELSYVISLVLTIATVFCTPNTFDLMSVPFIPTGFASHYIQELKKISDEELLSIQVINFMPSLGTIFNMLLIAFAISIIISVVNKNYYNIRHYIILIGAIFLLSRSGRFRYEFVLLAIPLIGFNKFPLDLKNLKNKTARTVCIFILLVLMIMPFKNLTNIFGNMPKYPFSERNLPAGVVRFLNHIDLGGRVLNGPNYGGYLQWTLYPKYKIFMDMEVPFLFTNEDIFEAFKMFNNKDFFKKVTEKYKPSFIIVSNSNRDFQNIIESFPEYSVVFFDDVEVLYMNSNHLPEIARQHKLNTINPFVFNSLTVETLQKSDNLDEILNELLRMEKINPHSGIVNQAIAVIYNKKGQCQTAFQFAERIVKDYPESPAGYKVLGDCLKGLSRYNEAIASYEIAMKKGGHSSIQKDIGLIYFHQKRYKDAYNTLIKVMNIYSPNITYRELHDLILSAVLSNNKRDAHILFRYAFSSVPEWDIEWTDKYKKLETIVGIKED